MNTLRLAARNLLRNRRRTLSTLLTMSIGIGAILLFGGYQRVVARGLETGFVRSMGHLQIQHHDYFLYGSGNPAAFAIPDYAPLMASLRRDPVLAPMLREVAPVLNLSGIAGHYAAGATSTVMARGIDVAALNRMRDWDGYRFDDHPAPLALTGTPPDAAIIGTGLARVLQLCGPLHVSPCDRQQDADKGKGAALPADIAGLGDAPAAPGGDARIELLAATASGAPNVARLHVVRAVSQGVKEMDDLYLEMHLQQAQKLLYGAEPPRVSAIMLQLQDSRQMPAAAARLQAILPRPLVARDFATLQPAYGQTIGMFASLTGFVTLLIACVSIFTIGNTMNMAVSERTAEIGTLRAIGLKQRGVRRLFLTEGLLLGATGACAGIALALAAGFLINHAGLSWTPPGRVDPVPLSVRIWGEYRMLGSTACGLILLSLLSAWWPARRAAHADIVDALRHA